MKSPTICVGPGLCPHDACNREEEEGVGEPDEKERAETRLRDLRSWHGGNVPACEPDRSAYMDALRSAGEGDKDGV